MLSFIMCFVIFISMHFFFTVLICLVVVGFTDRLSNLHFLGKFYLRFMLYCFLYVGLIY